jgi:hypothetical protein
MTRADMDAVTRCLCGLDTACRRSRLRLAGTALRPRLPAVELHLPADQPAHRRLRRQPRTAAAYPLEVFAAMRAVWPADLPMSVRISAHDWAPGGNTADDAVVVARLFKAAGADFIDVSSGQTTRQARPVYGRMYQTPFSPTASATRWASAPLPWVPSARPTTPTASLAPAAPTCAPWPARTWPTRPGRCTRPHAWKAAHRLAPRLPERPRPALPRNCKAKTGSSPRQCCVTCYENNSN